MPQNTTVHNEFSGLSQEGENTIHCNYILFITQALRVQPAFQKQYFPKSNQRENLMSRLTASIFNDVIGPVMRGPSSSHVAGAARIGALVRQAQQEDLVAVRVYFDPNGSLAESYDGHGSDIGFVSGLLGIALIDPQVPRACSIAREKGLSVSFIIQSYGAIHPNTYRIEAEGKQTSHRWDAISVGGGMVKMEVFDGFPVSIEGGNFEYLITLAQAGHTNETVAQVQRLVGSDEQIITTANAGKALIHLKTSQELSDVTVACFKAMPGVESVVVLAPILPTRSSANCDIPFLSAAELLAYSHEHPMEFWEYATLYESRRGNTTPEHVWQQMSELLRVMENAISDGLTGTSYADRILGPQAYKMDEARQNNTLIPGDLHNRIITYITAIMEVKSAMGVIVAAPTAGSCGGLPGTLIGAGHSLNMPRDAVIRGLLAAGLIGVFIAESATFAAEVAGCQVECGAGSGMAAAGLVQMMHGSAEQCLDAASMALQNITGLACDPVANRVEVPCLGKNIMCGLNAVASANMALAGFDKVIPLDETIAAIYDIGLKLPLELRCTWGGLGKTSTSGVIRKRLENGNS